MKWRLRRTLHRLGLWRSVSHLRARAAYLRGTPHETDFRFFGGFRGEAGLFVDIGANAGQSAISFATQNPSARILSFEPNPNLREELAFTRRLLGAERFEFQMKGLGAQRETQTLYTPVIDDIPLWQEATLHPENLAEGSPTITRLRETTGNGPLTITKSTLEILPFDELGLKPRWIKLDVQGHETAVLRGMHETLARVRPIVMIEVSDRIDEQDSFIVPYGYFSFRYSPETGKLRDRRDVEGALNLIYIHQTQLEEIKNRGWLERSPA